MNVIISYFEYVENIENSRFSSEISALIKSSHDKTVIKYYNLNVYLIILPGNANQSTSTIQLVIYSAEGEGELLLQINSDFSAHGSLLSTPFANTIISKYNDISQNLIDVFDNKIVDTNGLEKFNPKFLHKKAYRNNVEELVENRIFLL